MKGLNLKFKKVVAFLVSFFMISTTAFGKVLQSEDFLKVQDIAKGIKYVEKQVKYDSSTHRINSITADLNDSDVKLIFSMAKDKVKKSSTLSKQIDREIFKGNNVVAGINADYFDMGDGLSTGPLVKGGAIIAGHMFGSEENVYPVFGIDNMNRAFVSNIHFSGYIKVPEANTTLPGEDEISIDNVNRENSNDKQLVVLTRDYNESGIIDISKYYPDGALTIVRGIKTPLKLGVEYEGIVESIGVGVKSVEIPEDGIVIASIGEKHKWLSSHLYKGDKIKLKVNYDRDIRDAIGAYTYILKNGEAVSKDDMVKTGVSPSMVENKRARTAIGITSDNRVIAITVDSKNGISTGQSYMEVAEELKRLGAVEAVGLDGGGSTQMNVRTFGDKFVTVANAPSNNAERALSNAILFASGASKTNAASNFMVSRDITIFKNNSFKFNVKGGDSNYNPLSISNMDILWQTTGGIGTIDANGLFKAAAKAGEGEVKAVFEDAFGSATVKVVEDTDSLSIDGNASISLKPKDTKQFNIKAFDVSGKPIIITNNSGTWSVEGGIGTIDANGLFKSNGKLGKGKALVKVGTKTAFVNIEVVKADTTTKPSTGKSLYFYGFKPSTPQFVNDIKISVYAKDEISGVNKASIKAKLDGKAIKINYNQSSGEISYTVKNLKPGVHNFEVEASDKAGKHKNTKFKGTINVANIKDDKTAPEIKELSPANNSTILTTTPRLFVSFREMESGVIANGIKMTLDEKNIKVYYSESWGGAYGLAASPLSEGKHKLKVEIKDKAGNLSSGESEFNVAAPIQPTAGNGFKVAFLSGTMGTSFLEEMVKRIDSEGVDILIGNGDIAAAGRINDLDRIKKNVSNNTIFMGNPGDRDNKGFNGYFGMSTYSFEYGNSLFISIDSSNGGITKTDPTQFSYLQEVLKNNKKTNIFIYTHYPTKNLYSSGNVMDTSDAGLLTKTLTEYKKKNSAKNINVVFGHINGVKAWSEGGVNYMYSGSGSDKNNVSFKDGGFLSYLNFNISDKAVVKSYIPVAENLAIIDEVAPSKEILLIKGAEKKLSLYGDFAAVYLDNILNVNLFDYIGMRWTSDSPDIVSVDNNGFVKANKAGIANITARSGGRECTVKINVISDKDFIPGQIIINPGKVEINPGGSINLKVFGYDIYGNRYLIDNSLVTWSIPKELGDIKNGVFTAAKSIKKDLNGVIQASSKGRKTKINVLIKKPKKK